MGDRASRPAIGFRYEPPPLFRWPMGFLQRHPRLTRQVNRAAAPFENLTKVILFSCNMCGQCVLHETGFTCPMNCPKQNRDGPCGGVRANGHCEVIPEMVCVWVKAERRSRRLPWRRDLFRVQAPLDWRRKGSSAIVNMLADPFAEDGEP